MLFENVKAVLRDKCGMASSGNIVAGISGGADSRVLLDILCKLDFTVIIAHLNHQLRSSADEEMRFVERLAAKYKVEFFSKKEDVSGLARKQKLTIEEAARNARYCFLFEIGEKKQAMAVAVAHQADDQAETILMNMLRGSGLNGLTGMSYRSIGVFHPEIPLIRPLLDCWRDEISVYCKSEKLEYVSDESNQDTAYTRNRIRLELIPELQAYNPQIKQSLVQMADLLRADKEFIEEYVKERWQLLVPKTAREFVEIDLDNFQKQPASLQRYFIKKILAEHFPQKMDLGAYQIESARKILARKQNSLNLQLNDQLVIRIENKRGILTTIKQCALPSEEWPHIEQELTIPVRQGVYALSKSWRIKSDVIPRQLVEPAYRHNLDSFCAYLDTGNLDAELHLRSWKSGDRYQPMGMHGKTIKLSDFWVNRKLPQRARKFWPLVFSGEQLVWIPGFQPSHQARITEGTREILLLKIEKITAEN